jgi:hypothetical protein
VAFIPSIPSSPGAISEFGKALTVAKHKGASAQASARRLHDGKLVREHPMRARQPRNGRTGDPDGRVIRPLFSDTIGDAGGWWI